MSFFRFLFSCYTLFTIFIILYYIIESRCNFSSCLLKRPTKWPNIISVNKIIISKKVCFRNQRIYKTNKWSFSSLYFCPLSYPNSFDNIIFHFQPLSLSLYSQISGCFTCLSICLLLPKYIPLLPPYFPPFLSAPLFACCYPLPLRCYFSFTYLLVQALHHLPPDAFSQMLPMVNQSYSFPFLRA